MSHQCVPVSVRDKWETSVDETTKHAGPGGQFRDDRWNKQVWNMSEVTRAPPKADCKQRARYQVKVASLRGCHLSKDLQKVRSELCKEPGMVSGKSEAAEIPESSRDEVRKEQCQEKRNPRGQVQRGLGDHSKVGFHSRAVWTLQSRHSSLVLLQKGDGRPR